MVKATDANGKPKVKRTVQPKEINIVLNGISQQEVTDKGITVEILDSKRDFRKILEAVRGGAAVLTHTIQPAGAKAAE
jgi:hypothetical protein